MAFKENLDLVLQYTKQFIDAAMPVAKQAYEVGLLTLRIDAVAILVQASVATVAIILISVAMCKIHKWDMSANVGDATVKWLPTLFAALIGVGVNVILYLSWARDLHSVWVWTKLLAPELWLAHEAIEKVMK
jgi:hypothetical protein